VILPHVAADIILVLHLTFIVFVSLGGLLVLCWPRLAWLHLPCVAWGVVIELSGGVCPLTPLEQSLRLAAGNPGYSGDFIDQYLWSLVYPAGLTHGMQVGLGIVLLLINSAVYFFLWNRQRHKPKRQRP
jgi:hypothetical protein